MVQSSQQLYQQLVNHERAPARKRHTLSACTPKTSALSARRQGGWSPSTHCRGSGQAPGEIAHGRP
jgi:hypothetical protein